LETEDWSSQTILAKNGGATNEPRTGDVEAACSGQIGMAQTRDNGHVNDKLLKKEIFSSLRKILAEFSISTLETLFIAVILGHWWD